MEREANYAAVGAFVLLVMVMAGLFVYWYAESREARDYARYEIYFEGSVSGLARGAPVRYLGVDVGRVRTLLVDPRSSSRVQVVADIDSSAPVSSRTVAELSLQGITGLLYIDLTENSAGMTMAETVPSERYPVIPAVQSSLDLILASLPELVSKANAVMSRISALASDENVESLTAVIQNAERASSHLPATLQNAEALVADLRVSAGDFGATMATFKGVANDAAPEVSAALDQLRAAANNLETASARLDRFLATNEGELGAFARDGIPEIERLMRDARAAATEVRDLSQSLGEQPSALIYRPNYFGVEVPP